MGSFCGIGFVDSVLAYQKKSKDENRSSWRKGVRAGFDTQGGAVCKGCFEKKLLIDELREANKELKSKVQRLEARIVVKKQLEGGVHTPKSRMPFKKNADRKSREKKGGAKVGHKGKGRKGADEATAAEVIDGACDLTNCSDCGGALSLIGVRPRTLVESKPVKAQRIVFRGNRYRCKKCKKQVEIKPEALPRSLYGNRLLAQAAVMHYFHGISIGRLIDLFGKEVTEGGLIQAFHRLGKYCEKALPQAIAQYRGDKVRHADETPWRTDGHSGYAWLFSTDNISILEFTDSRSSRTPQRVLGTEPLKGVLVVDRYAAYNKSPVELQYCFAHLLRDVQKVEYDFPADRETVEFSSRMSLLVTEAIKLRGIGLSDDQYYSRAKQIRIEINKLAAIEYKHLAIKRVQLIFITNAHRLYHWVSDRKVPADNNKAERELRPTVIARKVSFASQSDAGAKTRGAIMSILFSAKKRLQNNQPLEEWFKNVLDQISKNTTINPFELLPPVPS
jgi:transposase